MRPTILIKSIRIDGQEVGFFRLANDWREAEDGFHVTFQLLQEPYAGEILTGELGKARDVEERILPDGAQNIFDLDFDSANVRHYQTAVVVGPRQYDGRSYIKIPPGIDKRGMVLDIIWM